MSRRDRERRAYQLVVAGGVSGGVAVVGGLLAIFGVIGWGLPFVAAVVMVICLVLFRRLVRPSR
jgi:heme O synthase-like polyprenyltransferase